MRLKKSEVNAMFKNVVKELRGKDITDKPALDLAWGLLLDTLQRSGQITARQYDTWLMPRGMV